MRFLLFDANVLIDFFDADASVFRAIADSVGGIHVALPVLAEVAQLTDLEAEELGLTLIDPPLRILAEAAANRGALSFQDRLCLELARSEGWTCVTNDGRLRRECATERVDVLWGLELIAITVEAGGLPRRVALELGETIAKNNPKFITADVLGRFRQRVG